MPVQDPQPNGDGREGHGWKGPAEVGSLAYNIPDLATAGAKGWLVTSRVWCWVWGLLSLLGSNEDPMELGHTEKPITPNQVKSNPSCSSLKWAWSSSKAKWTSIGRAFS